MDLEPFHAARRRLGVKRLFYGGCDPLVEILLNGEKAVRAGSKKLPLHVVDEDGVTILATKTAEALGKDDAFGYNEHWPDAWPAAFERDREAESDELDEWLYKHFSGRGDLAEFETLTDRANGGDAFYRALNVPLAYIEDHPSYARAINITFVHPELVQQWRDMVDAAAARKKLAELQARIEARAGAHKRTRTDDGDGGD